MKNILRPITRLIAITIAALAAATHPVGAEDIGTLTLTDCSQTAPWSGELQQGLTVTSPQACVSSAVDACDWVKVSLNVPAPEDCWATQPGGMLVTIKPRNSFANLFSLYIYAPGDDPLTCTPPCKPISKSENLYSLGYQGVWVENPVNGDYTVVVVPYAPTTANEPATYDGLVSFDRGLTVKREDELNNGEEVTRTFVAFGQPPVEPVELLPDLVPITPFDFHLETGTCIPGSLYFCAKGPRQQQSCYPEETAGATSIPPSDDHPTVCLRFTQGEYNFGDGPLEIRLYPSKGTADADGGLLVPTYQLIYSSDGKVSPQSLGEAKFHESHGHFHNLGWRSAALHTLLPNGTAGEIVIGTDGKEAKMRDKGVCMLDVLNARFGQLRDSPQAYGNSDPNPCSNPSHQDPNDPTFPNENYIQSGISVGWADVYPWPVMDQYINITKVPDGKYALVVKVNVDAGVREKTKANNTAMACVEISGSGTIATAIPCILPLPTSAMSRKTHGSAGTFDVDLPLAGSPGIECRTGGASGDYQLVVTFAVPVTFTGATMASGTGTVSSSSGSGTTAVTVNLTGVTNAQTITLTLSGVNDGTNTGDVGVRMGVLVGDVTGNGIVSNAGDVNSVKAQVSLPVTASNFRNDVTANGVISNSGDVATTKAQVSTQLP